MSESGLLVRDRRRQQRGLPCLTRLSPASARQGRKSRADCKRWTSGSKRPSSLDQIVTDLSACPVWMVSENVLNESNQTGFKGWNNNNWWLWRPWNLAWLFQSIDATPFPFKVCAAPQRRKDIFPCLLGAAKGSCSDQRFSGCAGNEETTVLLSKQPQSIADRQGAKFRVRIIYLTVLRNKVFLRPQCQGCFQDFAEPSPISQPLTNALFLFSRLFQESACEFFPGQSTRHHRHKVPVLPLLRRATLGVTARGASQYEEHPAPPSRAFSSSRTPLLWPLPFVAQVCGCVKAFTPLFAEAAHDSMRTWRKP